jgi:hypothetical protein
MRARIGGSRSGAADDLVGVDPAFDALRHDYSFAAAVAETKPREPSLGSPVR